MDKWGEADWEIYKEPHYPKRPVKRTKEESIGCEKMVELKKLVFYFLSSYTLLGKHTHTHTHRRAEAA